MVAKTHEQRKCNREYMRRVRQAKTAKMAEKYQQPDTTAAAVKQAELYLISAGFRVVGVAKYFNFVEVW